MAKKLTKAQWKKRKRLKRKLMKYGILLGFAVILVLILLLIIKLFTWIFSSHDDGMIEKVGTITVTDSLLSVNEYSRPGIALESVSNIVIHSTGIKDVTAQSRRDAYEALKDTKDHQESVHFVVGLDGEILQLIPTNEVSCSSSNYNRNSISIEFCESGSDGSMSQATYQSLTTLVAYLCDVYNVDIDNVKLHHDITGVVCPRLFTLDSEVWDSFLANVKLAKDGKNYTITNGVVDPEKEAQAENEAAETAEDTAEETAENETGTVTEESSGTGTEEAAETTAAEESE